MNVKVSIAKINACIIPTNTSKIINGNGMIYGTKKAITKSNISPAKILPNNLKENESTFTLSDIISKKPRINATGLEKLKNLLKYPFSPRVFSEKNWMENTENRANANVVVKSLLGERRIDTSPVGVCTKKDPKKPGMNATKFAVTIKKKKVEMSGNIFFESSLF
jgi:hypothetical protein